MKKSLRKHFSEGIFAVRLFACSGSGFVPVHSAAQVPASKVPDLFLRLSLCCQLKVPA